jgi:hypothetical protein
MGVEYTSRRIQKGDSGSMAAVAHSAEPLPMQLKASSRLKIAPLIAYAVLLCLVSIHLYKNPIYSMDSIQYMGNALLMEVTDPVIIHQRVYSEINLRVPRGPRDQLLGRQSGAPEDQNESRRQRATNPYRFMEFLPLFAIRPLYNQALWLVSKTGMGLVRASIFLSVAPYFLLGILLMMWVSQYVNATLAILIASLLMISPPLLELGRCTGSDALATLFAFLSLYLIFERSLLTAGLAILLASIYFRTDNLVLAGPVILACWLERRLDLVKASALALLALVSALSISHFAGDYGIKMLYFRNFVGTPVAPGEMTVQFSIHDYLAALRSGITLFAGSFIVPFLLVGIGGFFAARRMRSVAVVTFAYVLLHFVALPNWQERWFGVFYLSMAVAAAETLQGRMSVPPGTARLLDSQTSLKNEDEREARITACQGSKER